LGSPTSVDLSGATADQFGKYRNWNEVMGANGPFDETSFCFELGCWLMRANPPLLRQAAVVFNRVRQLAPDNLASRLVLAEIYVIKHQPDSALDVLHDPIKRPMRFALTDFNSTELNELVASAYFEKNQVREGVSLLEKEMDRHPDDENLMLVSAKTFILLKLHTNALAAVNRKLGHTPNDPNWLFGKGVISLEAGAYNEAVTALSRCLELQTNQPAALFDRGLAYIQSTQFDNARADFLRLQAAYTNNFQVQFYLGEIAWRQHQTNEAIPYYKLCLASAPTNSPEQKTAQKRLTDLGGK
jgi:predicted Zn-dependent protease